MTGTARSSEGLEPRRRKLLFRAWHRGIREMDLILGAFADAEIETMSDADMDSYELLLELRDADILSWITGEGKIPPGQDTPLLRKIIASCGATAN